MALVQSYGIRTKGIKGISCLLLVLFNKFQCLEVLCVFNRILIRTLTIVRICEGLVVVTATHSSLHSVLAVHDQHLSIDPVVLTAEIYLMEVGKVMKSMNIVTLN